jgi:hypothetical protein
VALDGNMLYLSSEGRPWNRAGRFLGLRCNSRADASPSAERQPDY